MAATAFYHSKKYPRNKDPQLKILDKDSVNIVKILSIFLSIAESLDRSHNQRVESVSMNIEQGKPVLEVKAQEGLEIELWSIEKHQKYFKKLFGKKFNVQNIKPTEG
jgi:exopolyphosphatase/guanosine-5'-triphosphate,3'-diphosphate pyrophosphatase